MTPLILLGMKLSVAALILAIGLGATVADLTWLWRRPGRLLRALFAMYVVLPAAGFLLLQALELPDAVEVAMLVLAVSAGAPLLPRKLMKIGHGSYMLSLVAFSSLAAVVAVPLWMEVLQPVYGLQVGLTPLEVGWAIGKAFVLPLSIGMLVRWRWPELGRKLSERILAAAGATMLVCALALLVLHGGVLLRIGWNGWAALALMTAGALAVGHLFGGPDEADRTALAIACATRHVGIAILVASSIPGAQAAVLVVAYLVAAALVTLLYMRLRAKAEGAASA